MSNAEFARIGPGMDWVWLIGTAAPEPRGGEQVKRPPRGGGSSAAKPLGFGILRKELKFSVQVRLNTLEANTFDPKFLLYTMCFAVNLR